LGAWANVVSQQKLVHCRIDRYIVDKLNVLFYNVKFVIKLVNFFFSVRNLK